MFPSFCFLFYYTRFLGVCRLYLQYIIPYRPKNEDEIEKLSDAFCGVYYRDFDASMIGKWLCVEVDSNDDLSNITTLDEAIAYASDVLSKLGYDLTVTKRGDDNEAD